ncbi:hypothetical protein HMN09_00909200 [Mycena chlorophos]|uniref:Conserved oligomeric Golgi complex subunit 8 n=1 Tax=Mycena chlorophos TaxID=658473 RepID=A0A8H6SN80_MYCCL|nr:hypothetical protein HMN09_00909200 [Mycena chlorophos]
MSFANAASLTEVLRTNTPQQQQYQDHLTSLDLPTLLAEPAALQTQAHHLTSSLTSLTHTSYHTFLSLHQSTSSLSSSLESLSASLDSLLVDSLPALEDSAARWRDRTDSVLTDRRKARVVLEQHDKIRDLLEIPMLIDTCVRNGYFAEALSLAGHARSFVSSGPNKSKPPPLILSSVLSEVQNSITHMLFSLLATLHDPSRKLPALWKAVNFLRKMDVFGAVPASDDGVGGVQPEEQIALAFLGGREACLRALLEGPARDIHRLVGNSASLGDKEREELAFDLRKYIDVWREHFNDIVTQFTTIFLERSPSAATAPTTPITPHSRPLASLHPLLTKYTTHVLSTHLFPVLEQTLPLLSMAAISTALRQLTYCASAFARHGLDFRGSLRGLFCRVVAGTASADFKSVGSKWVEKLKNATGDSSSSGPLSPTLPSASRKPKPAAKLKLPSQWLIIPRRQRHTCPPQILVSYPPLAEHTNAVLSILNGLRHLASVELFVPLTAALDGMLNDTGGAVLAYTRRVCEDADRDEQQQQAIALAAAEVYFTVLVPYLRRALVEGLYGLAVADWEGGGRRWAASTPTHNPNFNQHIAPMFLEYPTNNADIIIVPSNPRLESVESAQMGQSNHTPVSPLSVSEAGELAILATRIRRHHFENSGGSRPALVTAGLFLQSPDLVDVARQRILLRKLRRWCKIRNMQPPKAEEWPLPHGIGEMTEAEQAGVPIHTEFKPEPSISRWSLAPGSWLAMAWREAGRPSVTKEQWDAALSSTSDIELVDGAIAHAASAITI